MPAETWRALGKSSKPLRPAPRSCLARANASFAASRARGAEGLLEVTLFSPAGLPIEGAIEELGHVPLPPYIRRADEAADRERYQTVFAREPGAVAAPTAGLHLTEPLLERLRARGWRSPRSRCTSGSGRSSRSTVDDLDDHPMHAEVFRGPRRRPRDAIAARAGARRAGRRGRHDGRARARERGRSGERGARARERRAETRLLIQPGYRFRVVDRLLTNFHLPQSTLLALVCAFAGRERVLDAYRAAVAERYRFFSYGDAMLRSRTTANGARRDAPRRRASRSASSRRAAPRARACSRRRTARSRRRRSCPSARRAA